MLKKATKIVIDIAKSYIGVTEEGGDNKGHQVEIFQKAVDNQASRESWCMGFVQYCLMEAEKKFKKDSELENINKVIFVSEHCLEVWNKTDKKYKSSIPKIGDVVIWNFYVNGKQTTSGHAGIVTGVSADGKSVSTIEGNTGPGGKIERNGDGVYNKVRSVTGSASMKVVGFISPLIFQE